MQKIHRAGLPVGILLLIGIFFALNPEEHSIFPNCVFHSLSGFYCPGCGSQRAIHDLLHLNFTSVVRHNLLIFPALFAIGYHFLHPALNRWFGWKLPNIFYLKNTPLAVLAIIMLFWILRNIPFSPFTVLAPG